MSFNRRVLRYNEAMRSVFYPHLVNGPFGDPALYVRVAHQGQALLFDCGRLDPLTPRELLKTEVVLVSHAHIDHLAGFETLLRTFLYTDRELLLLGPPGMARQIEARLGSYTWNLVDGYPFRLTVREWCESGWREVLFRAGYGFRPEAGRTSSVPGDLFLETPDWTVRARPLAHGDILSMAYALEETLHVAIHRDALDEYGYEPGRWLTKFKAAVRRGDAADGSVTVPLTGGGEERLPLGLLRERIAHAEPGMKLVYVTDASPSDENLERIIALSKAAHLLVIEATFAHSELERARQRHHLTATLAGQLAHRAGVARLLVFHHSPRYLQDPERLAVEAHRAFAGE